MIKFRKEELKKLRVAKGWTQETLAEHSGIHSRTIQRIENDGTGSIQSLKALANALRIDPAQLVWDDANSSDSNEGSTPAQRPRLSMRRKQRHHSRRLAEKSRSLGSWVANGWVGWALVLMGAFLIVSVIFLTLSNPSREVVFFVFLPGTASGCLLMLAGRYFVYLSIKAREEVELAQLLASQHSDTGAQFQR